ncbi:MAG: hypothetical protein EOO05_06240 [Chitinophagaceae bacterium]|nr:MAG: hypothetical protein EOO05_06240 [Chitinophagaceae bacterium]
MNRVVGVDQFGRSFSPVSSMKSGKKVGLFFWLWIGQPYASGIYDATKILDMPNGLKILTDFAFQNETISPNGQAHFWGEPLWGYYNSDDVWVMRKQIEMLTVAGVDFIFFDATNAFIYKPVYERLLAVIDEYQKKGWTPPKVAFYTHSRSFQTIREIYRELYKPALFADTWYKVDNKPMIIGYTNPQDDLNESLSRGDNTYTPGVLSAEILNFFHFEMPQWPSDPILPTGFPWVEWTFPQPLHTRTMNVTVASHPSVPMSFSLTRGLVNWGRGWDPDTKTNNPQDVDEGTFFQRQWDHAIATDPDLVTVGGWNEWIAYKQPYWDEYVLVDAVNKEYSRDIEPMSGGYQDAFYIQMIKNIRRYKGVSTAVPAAKKKTIAISSGTSQWNDIAATGVNMNTERSNRSAYGATTKLLYTQPAADNLLQDVKVSYDDQNVYFFIRAKNKFTTGTGKANWLNILVGTGEPSAKSWESYEYRIGESFSNGTVSVGKLKADFTSVAGAGGKYNQTDNVIQIECSRESLGLKTGQKFYFKVAAGVDNPSQIMSYYTSGVSMPMGRLSYLYEFE